MSDSRDPGPAREPGGLRPHRVARTDQYLATAGTRFDQLFRDYQKAVAEDGQVSAANTVTLAMRLSYEHVDVAWIALVAMQRLHALQQTDEDPGPQE